METVSETEFYLWFGAFGVPLLVYGIWMRIKLMRSDEGEKFLQDREMANINTKRKKRSLGDEYAKSAGKAAKLGVGLGAANGAYGDEVSSIVRESFVFFKYFLVYTIALVLAAYMYFSWFRIE